METITGAEFKRRRQALGLTQDALAARIGVHKRTISRWEYGAYAVPVIGSISLAAIEAGVQFKASKRRRAAHASAGAGE
jgi:transcriptional regulator with XRE-family HTH domain